MADNMDLEEKNSEQEENAKCKSKENKQENKELQKNKEKGITMELFSILKRVILIQWIIIGFLIALNAVQGIYHDYKWSQFDTISVDGGDGGNAGYVGNDGDVNNYGEDSGSQEKK